MGRICTPPASNGPIGPVDAGSKLFDAQSATGLLRCGICWPTRTWEISGSLCWRG